MNNFHYFGLFLDTDTKNRLMDILTDNIDYNIALNVADKIFIDHCTLLHVSQLHGNSEIYNYLKGYVGEKFQIVINGVGISDKAMAFRVDGKSVVCVNDIPHITIATFRGGKPVDSNEITNWKDIEPITITVKLEKR